MVGFVPPPSYPTPNYDYFGQLLGSLPEVARNAQMQELALQQAQRQQESELALQQAAQSGALGQPGTQSYFDQLNQIKMRSGGGFDPNVARLGFEAAQYGPPPAGLLSGSSPQGGAPAGQPSPLRGVSPLSSGGGNDAISRLEAGIAKVESGGNYQAIGPVTRRGDRAYGKYQVMGANIPAWTEEVLGRRMTPREFLSNPEAQEAVARAKLGQYLEKTGSPQDAASMWFTGKPLAQGANRRDVNGMTGRRYAALATGTMSDAQPSVPPVSASAGVTIPRADRGEDGQGYPPIARAVGVSPGAESAPEQTALPNLRESSGIPQNVAQNLARITDPARREVAERAYADRTGRPVNQTGQAPQANAGIGRPISYVPKYPEGINNASDAANWANQKIEELQPYGRNFQVQERIKELEHYRQLWEHAAGTSREGRAITSNETGEVVGMTPPTNAREAALDQFLGDFRKKGKEPTEKDWQHFEIIQQTPRTVFGTARQNVEIEHPEWSEEQKEDAAIHTVVKQGTEKAFASGRQADLVRTFNVLVPHLEHLEDAARALKSKDTPSFTRIANWLSYQTGKTVLPEYNAIATAVSEELNKSIKGAAPTVSELEKFGAALSADNTLETKIKVINDMRQLAGDQLRGLRQEYVGGYGKAEEFDKKLFPETKRVFSERKTSSQTSEPRDLGGGWSYKGTR